MNIGILGCGIMGSQIALMSLINGHKVSIYIPHANDEEKYLNRILALKDIIFWKRLLSTKKVDETTIFNSLKFFPNFSCFSDSDLLFESIVEDLEQKQNLYKGIFNSLPDKFICSNTSSFSTNQLLNGLGLEINKIVCTHFFNPLITTKLVEISENATTEQVSLLEDFFMSINKESQIVRNVSGLLVNRIFSHFFNQAIYELFDSNYEPFEIDNSLKKACNLQIGLLELCEFMGNDTVLKCLQSLYESTGNVGYKPHPRFIEMVKENKLGHKSKEGFYKY